MQPNHQSFIRFPKPIEYWCKPCSRQFISVSIHVNCTFCTAYLFIRLFISYYADMQGAEIRKLQRKAYLHSREMILNWVATVLLPSHLSILTQLQSDNVRPDINIPHLINTTCNDWLLNSLCFSVILFHLFQRDSKCIL